MPAESFVRICKCIARLFFRPCNSAKLNISILNTKKRKKEKENILSFLFFNYLCAQNKKKTKKYECY